jgi:hypothetical protein
MIRAWVRQNGDDGYEAGFVSVETPNRPPCEARANEERSWKPSRPSYRHPNSGKKFERPARSWHGSGPRGGGNDLSGNGCQISAWHGRCWSNHERPSRASFSAGVRPRYCDRGPSMAFLRLAAKGKRTKIRWAGGELA